MTANERREEIIRNLVKEKKAIKGSELAIYFNVTRQVIVKDIAILEDVIVEHPLYGEIRGILKIKNLNDLNKFTGYFEKIDAKPLSALTNGVHLHTISADSEENMELIKSELSEKGFIL